MLILFSTTHCHLCDEAQALLNQFQQTHNIEYRTVEIAENDTLLDLYSTKIPVIKNTTTQNEISWPFQLRDLIKLASTD